MNLVEKVRKNIQDYDLINEKDSIVVGVSGGPDSMLLLHVLNMLKDDMNFKIQVAHINHMIRKEACFDEELVKKYCNKYDIPCHVLTADVLNEARMLKISTEECGRNIRYDFFNKILNDTHSNKIAVAHNLGDNAETMLLNLIRGAGLNGICGMKFKSQNLIRPLLNIDKESIIEYLKENNIEYAIDKTNFENDYTRNYIRNVLVPDLKKVNPNILNTMFRMSDILKKDEAALESITDRKTCDIIISECGDSILIDVKKFKELDHNLKGRVVMCILSKLLNNTQGIEQIHIKDIIRLLDNCITGKKYIIASKFYVEIVKNKKAKCVKATTIVEK